MKFIKNIVLMNKIYLSDKTDLVVIEPEIETIDLRLDSDSDDATQDDPPSNNLDKEVRIKQEPPDFDGLSKVQILATSHIPENVLDDSSNSKDRLSPLNIEAEKERRIQTLAAQLSTFMETTKTFVEPNDCEKVSNVDKQLYEESEQLINEKVDDYLKNKPNAPNKIDTVRVELITESSNCEIAKSVQAIINESTENLIETDNEISDVISINDGCVDDEEADDLIQAKAEEYFKKFEIKVNKSDSVSIENKAKKYADEYIEKIQDDINYSEKEDLTPAKQDDLITNKAFEPQPDQIKAVDEVDFVDEIIKQKADAFIKEIDKKKLVTNLVNDFQLPLEVDIDDEGIEFIDDGIEYIEEDDDCEVDNKKGKYNNMCMLYVI